MFVTMKEMLADAQQKHYALPAFDVSNYEMLRAVLDVCEEERSPALAAHFNGEEFSAEEWQEIEEFVRFVRSRRKK